MNTQMADLHRLSLLILRMLDAEMLLDAEGETLLQQTDAIGRSLEAGDTETARWHVEQMALFAEALIATNPFALTEGRAVIQITKHILNAEPGADDAPR